MTTLERLARKNQLARRVMDAFNPDQPRDERGRWGEGGPGSGASTGSEHAASAMSHGSMAEEHAARGEHQAARAHREAAQAHTIAVTALGSSRVDKATQARASESARVMSARANAASAKVGATPIKQTGSAAPGTGGRMYGGRGDERRSELAKGVASLYKPGTQPTPVSQRSISPARAAAFKKLGI